MEERREIPAWLIGVIERYRLIHSWIRIDLGDEELGLTEEQRALIHHLLPVVQGKIPPSGLSDEILRWNPNEIEESVTAIEIVLASSKSKLAYTHVENQFIFFPNTTTHPKEVRNISPNLLIEKVKQCYLTKKFITNPFHDPLPIEESYVRLALVNEEVQKQKLNNLGKEMGQTNTSEQMDENYLQDKRLTSFEEIHGTKSPIELEEIFRPNDTLLANNESPKHVLVLGRAGIGKSTLCQYISHLWAKGKLWTSDFDLIIWVPLRKLLDYPEGSEISNVILKECVHQDHTGKKPISADDIPNALEQIGGDRILYLLDGCDEVSDKKNSLIDTFLSRKNIFLTSRLSGIDSNFHSNRTLENIGFLDKDIWAFIDKYFKSTNSNDTLKDLLKQFLKSHRAIFGLAHIPINLMLICVYWQDNYGKYDSEKIKDVTMTELYQGLIANLCRRYLRKKDIPIGNLSDNTIIRHDECSFIIQELSRLAFQQMQKTSLLIPKKKLPQDLKIQQGILEFGILTPADRREKEYYFLHLTFQEFFAAYYIAEQLRNDDDEIKEFIRNKKYDKRLEMIWWFVAGLLKSKNQNNSRKSLEVFFEILESEPRDIGILYDVLLRRRCLYECQFKVNKNRNQKFLNEFLILLKRYSGDLYILCSYFKEYNKLRQYITRLIEFDSYQKLEDSSDKSLVDIFEVALRNPLFRRSNAGNVLPIYPRKVDFTETMRIFNEQCEELNRFEKLIQQSNQENEIIAQFNNVFSEKMNLRIRASAINILASRHILSKELLQRIIDCLDDSDVEIRKASILALNKIGWIIETIRQLGSIWIKRLKGLYYNLDNGEYTLVSFPQIMKVINSTDKTIISLEMMTVLVIKILSENVPIFKSSPLSYRVGTIGELAFNTKIEIDGFTSFFQRTLSVSISPYEELESSLLPKCEQEHLEPRCFDMHCVPEFQDIVDTSLDSALENLVNAVDSNEFDLFRFQY